jgi:sugar phosphate isomerase/epimerase
MKFGVCCTLEEAPIVLNAGFDYVELGASSLSEDASIYKDLPVEATNLFFPGTVKLFGPNATPYLEIARSTVDRAAAIGVKLMVIGSGASRTAPDGTDRSIAEKEFLLVAAAVTDHAKQYGITIAPESLNRSETNIGNDLACLAEYLRWSGVGYTADSYHVLYEWHEDFPNEDAPSDEHWAAQVPFLPSHVHIADLPRFAPKPSDPMVKGFAKRLLDLGYDGRVSLEYRRGPDFASELMTALADLKSLFQK